MSTEIFRMISPKTAFKIIIRSKNPRTLVSANTSCCLQAAQISYHNPDALKRTDTVHTYKFTFQGKKTTHPIIQHCHKHIHTYGRIACNGCSRLNVFFIDRSGKRTSLGYWLCLRGLRVPSKI